MQQLSFLIKQDVRFTYLIAALLFVFSLSVKFALVFLSLRVTFSQGNYVN
jgi:hypothetical protein